MIGGGRRPETGLFGASGSLCYDVDMGAAAQILEPFEQLIDRAPSPGAQVIALATAEGTPKALAERIVRQADRESRSFIKALGDSLIQFRSLPLSLAMWEAIAGLLSGRVKKLEAAILSNKFDAELALAQDPPVVPLPALRSLIQGLERVYATQHRALIDLHYSAMTEVWNRASDVVEVDCVASSPEELSAFFQQVRGV